MKLLLFAEKDLPNLKDLLKNNYPDFEIKSSYQKENLIRDAEEFKPDIIIANLNKDADITIVEKIAPSYPLIIISENIDPETILKFQKAGIVDWILFKYIDRIVVTIKQIQQRNLSFASRGQVFENFLNIVKEINDSAIIANLDGKVLFFNESFKKLLQLSSDIKELNIFSFIHPDDQEKFRGYLQKAKIIYALYVPELRIIVNNTIIYTLVVGHCLRNEKNEVEKIVFLLHDITQQKEIQNKISESEKLFRAIAETASFAIFIYQDNNFVYLNPSAFDMVGYSYDELKKMNFWDVVHPEFRELVKDRGIRRLRGEPVINRYEFKIQRKDNSTRWVDFSGSYVQYNNKPAALGIAYDITERKIAEERIKESHDFYLKLFNDFPTLLWMTDPNGNITFFNKTWLDFRGKTLEQEVKDGWITGVHPEDVHSVISTFRKSFLERKSFQIEYRIKNYQDEFRWVFIAGDPFHDPKGNFIGFIGSGYDITEKRDYEERINKLNTELKEKIKNLEDFKSVAIERELKMIELKETIKKLLNGKDES